MNVLFDLMGGVGGDWSFNGRRWVALFRKKVERNGVCNVARLSFCFCFSGLLV